MNNRLLLAASVSLALTLAACQDQSSLGSNRHLAAIPPATTALMASKGMAQGDPILMRAYKKESELEVWKKGRDGKYALLKTYPICRWSGQLGPKVREGDRQAPEGFYTITPGQMNPNSSFYLSFDTGYPNAYDRAHGRTGAHLMVHGTCSSSGCFAMTDEAISEVYAIAREAFAGGQRGFQFQSYPFRMTAENLAKHRADPNMAFWRNLKEGSDQFEVLREEPRVSVAGLRYDFGAENPAVAQKRAQDEQKVAELVGAGVPAVRTVYDDGGGHGSFHKAMAATTGDDGDSRSAFAFLDARASRNLGDVSRPEALAAGPREVPVETPAKGKDRGQAKGQVAAATAAPAPNAATASAQASAGETKSFYQRALGLFGKAEEPAPVASEPARPAAAAPAVPPRRGASSATGAKPQAATAAPERRASLPASALPGSQPVLPAGDGGFSRLN